MNEPRQQTTADTDVCGLGTLRWLLQNLLAEISTHFLLGNHHHYYLSSRVSWVTGDRDYMELQEGNVAITPWSDTYSHRLLGCLQHNDVFATVDSAQRLTRDCCFLLVGGATGGRGHHVFLARRSLSVKLSKAIKRKDKYQHKS